MKEGESRCLGSRAYLKHNGETVQVMGCNDPVAPFVTDRVNIAFSDLPFLIRTLNEIMENSNGQLC